MAAANFGAQDHGHRGIIVKYLIFQHKIRPFGPEYELDMFVGSTINRPNETLENFLRQCASPIPLVVPEAVQVAIEQYLGATPTPTPSNSEGYQGDVSRSESD